jgi:hypothetical protein
MKVIAADRSPTPAIEMHADRIARPALGAAGVGEGRERRDVDRQHKAA